MFAGRGGASSHLVPIEVGAVLDVVFGDTIWPEELISDDIEHGDCID